MKVLIINCILTTAEHGIIKRKETIGDCMISNFARGFIELGHTVTLLASEEFRPTGNDERLPFKVVYFPSRLPQVFKPSLLPWPKGMHRWLKAHADAYDLVIASESFQISSLIAARVCPLRLLIWQEMDRHQRLLFGVGFVVVGCFHVFSVFIVCNQKIIRIFAASKRLAKKSPPVGNIACKGFYQEAL